MSTELPFRSRREFLASTAFGVGAIALAHLLRQDGALADIAKKPGENLPLDLQSPGAALRSQGEGDDLAVHARRSVARRLA